MKYKIVYVGSSMTSIHVKEGGRWLLVDLYRRESALTEEVSPQMINLEALKELRIIELSEDEAERTSITDPKKTHVGFERAKREAQMARESIYQPPVDTSGFYMAHMKQRFEDVTPGATSAGIVNPSKPNEYHVDHREKIRAEKAKAKAEQELKVKTEAALASKVVKQEAIEE